MAKTKEEIQALKKECEDLALKLKELSDDELNDVTGGDFFDVLKKIGDGIKSIAKPLVKNPAPSVNSSFQANSSEETLGGKIFVVPTDEN